MAITRVPKDYFFGTLSQAAAISDTVLSSSVFANLANSLYSTSVVLPLTLHDPAQGIYEVVWVTAHVATSAQQVTVVRGKEGTSAQAWPSGTQVLAAPTAARDALSTFTSTTRPTDAHLGMRAVETDTGQIKELTSSGWHNGVYVDPSGTTQNHGAATPSTAVALIKAFTITSATPDSSGNVTISFPGTPFPNGFMSVVATPNNTSQTVTQLKTVSGSVTTSGCQVACHTGNGGIPTDKVSFDMIVIGY